MDMSPGRKAHTALPPSGPVSWSIFQCTEGSQVGSWSGHKCRLWVQSLAGVGTRSNQLVFLSHLNVFLSLYSFPLSNQKAYPWVRIIKKKKRNTECLSIFCLSPAAEFPVCHQNSQPIAPQILYISGSFLNILFLALKQTWITLRTVLS